VCVCVCVCVCTVYTAYTGRSRIRRDTVDTITWALGIFVKKKKRTILFRFDVCSYDMLAETFNRDRITRNITGLEKLENLWSLPWRSPTAVFYVYNLCLRLKKITHTYRHCSCLKYYIMFYHKYTTVCIISVG
jgi:hypothetical protein